MSSATEVEVTLSKDLYREMRAEARKLGVPISWLVASLVADTVDLTEDAQIDAVAVA